MRVLAAVGLAILFAIGAVLGLAIGLLIFPISLYRGARAVHAEGVVCRAELTASDPIGQRLVGPALVRLSGAFEGQASTSSDVLGLEIRYRKQDFTHATRIASVLHERNPQEHAWFPVEPRCNLSIMQPSDWRP